MADISIDYMGLKLGSPVIAGSSTLTKDMDSLKKAEDAGAGAVVLKSLFEEELRQDAGEIEDDYHPEAYDYMNADAAMVYGSAEYLEYVKKAADKISIPVIASINCEGTKWWTDFAANIEEAGADAIELNVAFVPFDKDINGTSAEQKYIDVVKSVKNKVDIPVAVKIGSNFSAIPNMVQKLQDAGADSITMFNKYFQLKINTKTLELEPIHTFSEPSDAYSVLRWVAITSRQCNIDISATTGVYNEDMLLQYLLAGAKTVQVASALYKDGMSVISDLNSGLASWMKHRNIENVSEMIGLAAKKKVKQVQTFERLQYIKIADGAIFQ
ncbi:MAG: dihydroorotate oxidase [Denitrovibrio sp.]|nr:MAG: dihydroorotate oxidase [Denitrovibrio sp.]